MAEYQKARKRIEISMGESVRIIRELQGSARISSLTLSGLGSPRTLGCHGKAPDVNSTREVAISGNLSRIC